MGNDAMCLMQAVCLDEFAAWVPKWRFFISMGRGLKVEFCARNSSV